MSGERDLLKLLESLSPEMGEETYVFCTLAEGTYGDLANASPLASIREEEGLTLIVSRRSADELSLPYSGTFRCISLKVHSSLEAVGLTAVVAGALAKQGISANMVAGYYHDHILVPSAKAERALSLLQNLAG